MLHVQLKGDRATMLHRPRGLADEADVSAVCYVPVPLDPVAVLQVCSIMYTGIHRGIHRAAHCVPDVSASCDD